MIDHRGRGSRRGRRRQGFSLLEILLSLAILGGSLAILVQIVNIGTMAARESRSLSMARILCQTKLAEVLLDGTAGITPLSIPETPLEAFDSSSTFNSSHAESFPSWSENGRWIMFASKGLDGLITLPWFSFVDSSGKVNKPFVIPFENPSSYDTRLTNLNRPVFTSGRIKYTQRELLEDVYSNPTTVLFDSVNVDIDALAGATVNIESSIDETTSLYKKN